MRKEKPDRPFMSNLRDGKWYAPTIGYFDTEVEAKRAYHEKYGTKHYDTKVEIRVTPTMKEKLDRYAAEMNMKTSDYVREILQREIEHMEVLENGKIESK